MMTEYSNLNKMRAQEFHNPICNYKDQSSSLNAYAISPDLSGSTETYLINSSMMNNHQHHNHNHHQYNNNTYAEMITAPSLVADSVIFSNFYPQQQQQHIQQQQQQTEYLGASNPTPFVNAGFVVSNVPQSSNNQSSYAYANNSATTAGACWTSFNENVTTVGLKKSPSLISMNHYAGHEDNSTSSSISSNSSASSSNSSSSSGSNSSCSSVSGSGSQSSGSNTPLTLSNCSTNVSSNHLKAAAENSATSTGVLADKKEKQRGEHNDVNNKIQASYSSKASSTVGVGLAKLNNRSKQQLKSESFSLSETNKFNEHNRVNSKANNNRLGKQIDAFYFKQPN